MINVVCGIRSTGRICTDMAEELEKRGHQVKIAYGRETVPQQYQKYAVRIGSSCDVNLHALKARLSDKAGFGSRRATEKFIRWVKRYNPDMIHLHNIHGYYINVEVLFGYLRTCGKKIVWTLHDCWAFTGHSVFCDAQGCMKWKQGCSCCPQTKEYPKSYTDRSSGNWKKKRKLFTGIPDMQIVTPSHWLAGLVKESFLSEYRVAVIHNGIDTEKFYPVENDFRKFYGLEGRIIVLGAASTWNEMKGYSDFVKLAEILGGRYKVVLAGLTGEQVKKLPHNILGIRRTSSTKEMAMMYSASDVFVNLTYCDTFPSVNLEAQACGLPVVTYQTGGSLEAVIEGTGYAVEKGNVYAAAAAVEKLVSEKQPLHRLEISAKARDRKETVREYLEETGKYAGGIFECKAALGLLGKRVIFGVSAFWEKRKGIDDMIGLSKILDGDSRMILAGICNARAGKIPERVLSYGQISSAEGLRQLYAVADIYLNPTYDDNYPSTNLEALACGTPVLTYDTGGSAESALLFGRTVKKSDIESLKTAVENWNDVSAYCRKQKRIENEISRKHFVEKYCTLYDM